MKIEQSWAKPLALALSLPGTILTLGYIAHALVEKKVVSKEIAFGIFLAIVINILLLMVLYVVKKKNKPQ